MTTKRALLNFTILQDIPFDVGQVIEDAIFYNKDAKMNLGHPFLLFGLCKRVGAPLEDNEAWIHPIKAISVKKDNPGIPCPESMHDSGNEPSDVDVLREYQSRFSLPRLTLARPPPIHHGHRLPPIHHGHRLPPIHHHHNCPRRRN